MTTAMTSAAVANVLQENCVQIVNKVAVNNIYIRVVGRRGRDGG